MYVCLRFFITPSPLPLATLIRIDPDSATFVAFVYLKQVNKVASMTSLSGGFMFLVCLVKKRPSECADSILRLSF